MEHKVDGDTNCNWCPWNNPQILIKRLKDFEIIGQIETILIAESLRSARILRRILETWGDLRLLKLHLCEKLSKE